MTADYWSDFAMRLFNTNQASRYLGKKGIRLSAAYLKKLRSTGAPAGVRGGISPPAFHRQGRFIVYSDAALDEYAEAVMAETLGQTYHTTSDYKSRPQN